MEKTQINFRQAEHTFDSRTVRFVEKYSKTLLYLAILELDNHKALNLQGDLISSAFTVTDGKIAPYIVTVFISKQ